MKKSSAILLIIASLVAGCAQTDPSGNGELKLAVNFPVPGIDTPLPVRVDAPDGFEPGNQQWEVVASNGIVAPVQIADGGRLVFLWSGPELPGTAEFKLRSALSSSQSLTIEESTPRQLLISENGSPVIGYVFGMHLADDVPEDRRRASYFHPVWGVNGKVLSDDFPRDHYHHRGFFWTWPQVLFAGDTLSLWDIRGIHQKFENWTARESGPVFVRLGVQNGWYLADGRRIVDEHVSATIYRSSGLGRVIDFELRWEATGERVGIQGSADAKGYGGFSLRFAPFEEPVITTSDSVQSGDSNLIPAPWADLTARFAGNSGYEGVAIFDHRDNVDFPNGWCLRHYGFEGIAWPGIEPYWLEPGKSLTARYRVWIHDGDAVAGKVPEVYNCWSKPPVTAALQ